MFNMKADRVRAEYVKLLNNALKYSLEFQKPAQIEYYRAQLDYIDGLTTEKPKANHAQWDTMNCVIDAQRGR